MEDIIKSIKATLYDRAVSPLFGSFLMSWLAWNHRMLVVLLSGMSVTEKFNYVDYVLYVDRIKCVEYLIAGPVVTAVLILFVYPFPAKWTYSFWRRRQKELKEIRQKIEDETPLTIEESRKIRRQVVDIQAEYEKQIAQKSAEVEGFKSIVGSKDVDLKNAQELISGYVASATKSSGGTIPNQEIERVLLTVPYKLQFNPDRGVAGSKLMMFGSGGKILEGGNQNEASWRVVDGKLEFINSGNELFSRFDFNPPSKVFTHTNDPDTLSLRGQYLTPSPESAEPTTQIINVSSVK